jgi:soluble lytic murein transglycosylase-like protein
VERSAFPKAMSTRRITVAMLAAGFLLAVPRSSFAQITTYVDESGKRVFVNEYSSARRSGSTINTAAAAKDKDGVSTLQPTPSLTAVTHNADSPDLRLERIIQETAARHRVDPALVKAVIKTESGGNQNAISRKGAVGLMQLIPGTAQRFGVGNLFDPAQNVEAGTTYLRTLLDRYNGDLTKSLAAYNAGERAVDLSGGVPWYPETRKYVRKVTDAYFRPDSGRDQALWTPPPPPVRQETDSRGRVIFTNE